MSETSTLPKNLSPLGAMASADFSRRGVSHWAARRSPPRPRKISPGRKRRLSPIARLRTSLSWRARPLQVAVAIRDFRSPGRGFASRLFQNRPSGRPFALGRTVSAAKSAKRLNHPEITRAGGAEMNGARLWMRSRGRMRSSINFITSIMAPQGGHRRHSPATVRRRAVGERENERCRPHAPPFPPDRRPLVRDLT
jgi:hypothetical protein